MLDSLFLFVSTRVLEVDVAGKMVSGMCHGAARARPEMTLKKFLPYLTNCIKNLATGKFIVNETTSHKKYSQDHSRDILGIDLTI